MNKESFKHLTNQGVRILSSANSDQEQIVLQIVGFQPKNQKNYFYVSDGYSKIKALAQDQSKFDPKTDLNTIIIIKSHMVSGKGKSIGIIDAQSLFKYKSLLGNPKLFSQDSQMNPETDMELIKIDQSLIIQKQNKLSQKNVMSSKNLPATLKKAQSRIQQRRPLETHALKGSLRDYQTIKMLYIGMDRWTIVCRIVKLDYNQFISKKTNKDTKVLNIELMDRSNMKISGVFFGEAALKYKQLLLKDHVYKISQGQIRQESYNNSKNEKLSPFKLVFNQNAVFEQISDVNSICRNQDTALTLAEVIQKRTFGQQFDVICILVDIQQPVQIKKNNQAPLIKINLLVADPIKSVTMHAVLWSQSLIPSRSLIGKSIILSRFRLNEYNQSLNLGSVFRSSIIPVQKHEYQNLETKVMMEFQQYEKLHAKKSSNSQNYQVCHNTKDLQRKIQALNYNQMVRSDLTVCLNKMAFKKWCYDGCPYCQKSAQRLGNCPNPNCSKYIQNTIPHFIMGIQISDAFGSVWTTAYDQLGKTIFGVINQQPLIQKMRGLQANQLKDWTQGFLYKQFKVRINSKKDNQGKIKHNIGKIYERDYAAQTLQNLNLINQMM